MNKVHFIILSFLLLFSSVAEISAQRRRNKDAVSSSTRVREAEYYFTEGEKYYILEDYAKALALFQKSLEMDPNNSAAYYKKAQIEYENEEYDKALKDSEKAIEIDAKNKYYYLLQIEILSDQGRFDEAVDSFEKMMAEVEGTDQYLYEVAAIHLFRENYDEALQAFQRLEEKFGLNEEIVLQRQKIYARQGKDKEALEELEYLVGSFPENDNYRLALAEFYLGQGNSDKSITVLTEMLELFPAHPRASLLLGEIYRKDKKYIEATPYLESAFQNSDLSVNFKVQLVAQYKTLTPSEERNELIERLCIAMIENHPEQANVYSIYGDFLLESQKPEAAAENYHKSLDIDESNFTVWQNLVLLYSRMNDFDNLILTADKAMIVFPNQNILYYLSGFAHLRKQMFQESVTLLKAGLRLASGEPNTVADFNGLLGEAYHGLKDYSRSDQAFDAVLEVQPDNYIVLNNYSFYLAERNENLEKAEKMSAKLVKDNPDNANFLDTHAWVLYVRKKYKDARKIAEKAVDSGKAKAVHYEHYGDILFKLGDVDGAVTQWQKAKGMDSSLKFIDKKIADRKLYEN